MRVLILLDAFSLGGAEKQALLFAEWLQNTKGETVEIWAFMPGDGSAKILCDRYKLKTRVIGYFRGFDSCPIFVATPGHFYVFFSFIGNQTNLGNTRQESYAVIFYRNNFCPGRFVYA